MLRSLFNDLSRWWLNLMKGGGDLVDFFKPRGDVELIMRHAHGPLKGQIAHRTVGRNIITSWLSVGGVAPTSGRDLMRRAIVPSSFTGSLKSDDAAVVARMQLGSGGTLETAGDSSLQTAIGGTAKDISSVIFDPTNPYVTFVVEYDETEANATLREVCLLSKSGRNDFIARKTFSQFTKSSDFTLELRWTIKF